MQLFGFGLCPQKPQDTWSKTGPRICKIRRSVSSCKVSIAKVSTCAFQDAHRTLNSFKSEPPAASPRTFVHSFPLSSSSEQEDLQLIASQHVRNFIQGYDLCPVIEYFVGSDASSLEAHEKYLVLCMDRDFSARKLTLPKRLSQCNLSKCRTHQPCQSSTSHPTCGSPSHGLAPSVLDMVKDRSIFICFSSWKSTF